MASSQGYFDVATIAFKAGRAFRRGDTNWVDPDPRKGLVSVRLGREDNLLHFYWANRQNNDIEEDLILFPGDATFAKVEQAQGGRTYVLKFSSSDQRLFFWMQDRDPSKDEENVRKLNRALSELYGGNDSMQADEPEPSSSTDPSAAGAAVRSPIIPPPAPVLAPAQPAIPVSSGVSPEELARLRALLRGVGVASGSRVAFQEPDLSLSDLLTTSTLSSVLSNDDLLSSLVYPNLPTDLPVRPSRETVRRVIESPPFQASVRNLDQALLTGQLQNLVVGLGLPPEAGTDVAAFLRAIGEQAKKQNRSGGDNMDTS
ncbi:hypothetical protein FRC02_003596 [Tulasnella sp. 418]|nr:hypothetical protein FRC02_003596 [Tulasnella sp. 418]